MRKWGLGGAASPLRKAEAQDDDDDDENCNEDCIQQQRTLLVEWEDKPLIEGATFTL